jgi:Tfp pilus assembly protein PilN
MLNVLPAQIKKDIKLNQIYRSLKRATILTTIILLIPIILLVGDSLFFQKVLKNKEATPILSISQSENLQKIKDTVQNFSTKMQKSKDIQANHVNPVIIVKHFTDLVPEGVEITSLGISIKEKTINFAGKAKDRNQLIQLQNNLSADDFFTEFSYPLSNLSDKEDIMFNYTGKIILDENIISKYAN